jgi:hypothetical protein
MNCPHCQKELPQDYGAVDCPFCGRNPSPEIIHGASHAAKPLAPIKFHAVAFFLTLLAPPILTMLTAWLVHQQNESYSVAIGFFGGGAAGIACGIMLGLRLGKTLPTRIVLSLLLMAVMAVVCILLCFVGCNFGGYQMRFN